MLNVLRKPLWVINQNRIVDDRRMDDNLKSKVSFIDCGIVSFQLDAKLFHKTK